MATTASPDLHPDLQPVLHPVQHPVQHWVDIVPPQAPAQPLASWLIALLVLTLLALAGLALWIALRPARQARRALRRLARDTRQARIDRKAACLQIRRLLASGSGSAKLRQLCWQHTANDQWQGYLDRLDAACFAAATPAQTELDSLIEQAINWLGQQRVSG